MEAWIPALSGQPIELLAPQPNEVDFEDVAWSMAHLNRFAGHARKPVSVGLHTLIGLDLAPEHLKAHWLLHDAAETRVGEHTSPAKTALRAVAEAAHGTAFADKMAAVLATFEWGHANAIHRAAGLPMPGEAEAGQIRRIDLVCLAIERRDFLSDQQRPWWIDEAGIEPHPRARTWMAPDKVADALLVKFRRYLPALQGHGGRTSY